MFEVEEQNKIPSPAEIQQILQEVNERCAPPATPHHAVELGSSYVAVGRLGYQVLAKHPTQGPSLPTCLANSHWDGGPLEHLEWDARFAVLDEFTRRCREKPCAAGEIFYSLDGTVSIRQTLLRPERLSIAEQAAAFYLSFRVPNETWGRQMPNTAFYHRWVTASLPFEKYDQPVLWARDIAAVIFYGISKHGTEAGPNFVELPLMHFVQWRCERTPERLHEPLKIDLTPTAQSLIDAARLAPNGAPNADLAALLLRLDRSQAARLVQTEAFSALAKTIVELTPRGLPVDRTAEYLTALIERGVPAAAAAQHLTVLLPQLFPKDPPWWFNPDLNLKVSLLPENRQPDLQLIETLARAAGPGLRSALDLYQAGAHRLLEVSGLTYEQGTAAIAKLALWYGIGNPERAAAVTAFALQTLQETEPAQRAAVLERVLVALQGSRPVNELVGVLQGSDLPFVIPGLVPLSRLAKSHRLLPDIIHATNTVTIENLRSAAAVLALPEAQRRVSSPQLAFKVRLPQRPLLTQAPRPALPAPADPEPQPVKLLPQWFDLHAQLMEECPRWRADTVANNYFGFFAAHFHDPFSPPRGFLRFLDAFEQLPIEGLDSTIFARDEADAKRIVRKNAQIVTNRNAPLIALIEAYRDGLIRWEDLQPVFDWIMVPLPANLKTKHLHRQIWDACVERAAADLSEPLREMEAEDDQLHRQMALFGRFQKDGYLAGGEPGADFQQPIADLRERRAALIRSWSSRLEKLLNWENALTRSDKPDNVEHAVEQAGFEARREQEAEQVRRFERLTELVENLAPIRELVEAGILVLQPVRITLRDVLASVPQVFVNRAPKAQLQRVARLGAIDLDRVAQAVDRCENLSDLVRFTNELHSFAAKLADHLPLGSSRPVGLLRELQQYDFLEPSFLNFCQGVIAEREQLERLLAPFAVLDGGEALPARSQRKGLELLTGVDRANEVFGGVWRCAKGTAEGLQPRANLLLAPESSAAAGVYVLSSDSPSMALALRGEIKRGDPELHSALLKLRQDSFGLLPIGGKIHVIHEFNSERLHAVVDRFRLGSTAFKLIDADRALLLPPVPSAAELALLISLLGREGVITAEQPELQIGLPGRLPPSLCSVVGASVLLSTEVCKEFKANSYDTGQWNELTGFRIMAYDAQGPRTVFPFTTSLPGRTDILGRRGLSDAWRAQLVHTVCVHGFEGGPFAALTEVYRHRLEEVLERHGLAGVLRASWIKESEQSESHRAAKEHFLRAVLPCSQAWMHCFREYERSGLLGGVVPEVRELIDWLRNEARIVQEKMWDDPAYRIHKELLTSPLASLYV